MRLDSTLLAVAVSLCAVTLAGCTPSLGHGDSRRTESVPAVDRAAASAALVSSYLEGLQQLLQSGPAQQAEYLVAAQREYEMAPTPSHQLRYALVLATPGHAGTDLSQAQRLLRELLATPETLMPTERALAFLELNKVDRQLMLISENQRLQSEAERAERERNAIVAKQLQSQIEENARLRKELHDARAKLDAIATIERSINERKSGTEGRTP